MAQSVSFDPLRYANLSGKHESTRKPNPTKDIVATCAELLEIVRFLVEICYVVNAQDDG